MAPGVYGVYFALLVFGILTRLTPHEVPETITRAVKPENIGYYACTRSTSADSKSYALDKLFNNNIPRVNTSHHGRQIKSTITLQVKVRNKQEYFSILCILLCGDVQLNPGPVKCPCIICRKPVKSNQKGIQCDFCDLWVHLKCTNLNLHQYEKFSTSDEKYFCVNCIDRLPDLNDSFFLNDISGIDSHSFDTTGSSLSRSSSRTDVNIDFEERIHYNEDDIFAEVKGLKRKNPHKLTTSYININSLRYKFCHIKELLETHSVDILFLAETKIDESFTDAQFAVDGFHFWRKDRSAYGGGLAVYVRADLSCDRKCNLDFKIIESLAIEIRIDTIKWLINGVYRPQSIKDYDFNDDFIKIADTITTLYDSFMFIGDMNYDMLNHDKSSPLTSVCDIFDLQNLVKDPTCFTKNASPSLNDVILTNAPNQCMNVLNFNCGLSDVHNFISVQFKRNIAIRKTIMKSYRSFKNFSQDNFISDLNKVDFDSIVSDNNVDLAYSHFETVFINIANKHAPLKSRKTLPKPAPFMNSVLRKAVYKKKMLHNKYLKHRSNKNWEKYRLQRNLVNKIKKNSIKQYFFERCTGGPKSNSFWPTIKPFLSNKGNVNNNEIILEENNKIINDQEEVATTFNNFFINVAKDIGPNLKTGNDEHPSITKIKENKHNIEPLVFKEIDIDFIEKQINKANIKKATGKDGISPKLLKLAKPAISKPITNLINKTINSSKFPVKLKEAQVVPCYKKNNALDKSNYRPVSILPYISKFFERAINDQLTDYFNTIFHPFLSAFRSGYGCQTTLLKIVEDWKTALDENKYVAAILMDLSKAFDCLPHNLLLDKLKTYGLSEESLKLLQDYLSDRKQCVKLGSSFSNWGEIYKGVPQGSILGPVLFNIFLNDIFYFIHDTSLYNYADDNTLSYAGYNLDELITKLETDSLILIDWFTINHMKANPDKFQALAIGSKTHEKNIIFNINNNEIKCEDEVKLLGVTIDYQLKFNTHIANICKKSFKTTKRFKKNRKISK